MKVASTKHTNRAREKPQDKCNECGVSIAENQRMLIQGDTQLMSIRNK
jgi:hypothetical protein